MLSRKAASIIGLLLGFALCTGNSVAATGGSEKGLPADSKINSAVSDQIYFDPYFSPDQIRIVTQGDTPDQRWRARNAAMRVNGVVALDDKLQANSGSRAFNDAAIKKRIQSEIFWDPVVDFLDDHVSVSVKGGVATLTGSVDSFDEHWAATRDAFTAGASQVKNKLTIEDAKISGQTFTYNRFPSFGTITYWGPLS